MKMIPLLRALDMRESLTFYTTILDFELKFPNEGPEDTVVDLLNGVAEIQLTSLPGDQRAGFAVNVSVDDVDGLFAKYVSRGLDVSGHEGSPVHQGPIDQTWGMREFYVTDPAGNTLRFRKLIE